MFPITKNVKIKKLYGIICGKNRKFKNPKISNRKIIFEKTLVLSIICKNEDEKMLKKKYPLRY